MIFTRYTFFSADVLYKAFLDRTKWYIHKEYNKKEMLVVADRMEDEREDILCCFFEV